jgi:hypothetical protein
MNVESARSVAKVNFNIVLSSSEGPVVGLEKGVCRKLPLRDVPKATNVGNLWKVVPDQASLRAA